MISRTSMLKMSILVIFGPQDSLGFWPLEATRVKSPEVWKYVQIGKTISVNFHLLKSTLVDVYLNNFGKCKKKSKKTLEKPTFFNLPGLIFFSFVLSQPKNLTAFSASSKTFVPAQKTILLNANHLFVWHKMFVTGTICK